jgi:hypothetical protein
MSARICVTATSGPCKGREFVFSSRTLCTVGRSDDCLLRIQGDASNLTVSRRHCVLDIDPPSVRVRDLGSLNETFVNDRKIGQREKATPPREAALGKECGVEMHLPQLIDSVHAVQSQRINPYLAHNRMEICTHCAFLHSSICPCPMDYLAVLIVEAVKAVDQRRLGRERERQFVAGLAEGREVGIEEVGRAYEEGTGAWAGCDWPTQFGATGLDLNGCTAADAEAMAAGATGTEEAEDWSAAARWLGHVEEFARQAETHAAAAVKAAAAGQWEEAVQHAHRAWVREFSTGRLLRKGEAAWMNLRLAVESAYLARQQSPPDGELGGGVTS